MHSYSFLEQQASPGKLSNVNVFPDDDDIDIGVLLTADEGLDCFFPQRVLSLNSAHI